MIDWNDANGLAPIPPASVEDIERWLGRYAAMPVSALSPREHNLVALLKAIPGLLAAERERCAKVADKYEGPVAMDIVEHILELT